MRRLRTSIDLVDRQFYTEAPVDCGWPIHCSYVVEILYLAMVLDVYSRRVVGWSMKSHFTADLIWR